MLRRTKILATLTLASFGLTGCGLPGPEAGAGNVERGRAFAEANCGSCHAVGPDGESPYAASPPFRTLSQRYPIENLAEALAEGIGVTHGGAVEMPEFVLSPDEIDDFLAYLASIQEDA